MFFIILNGVKYIRGLALMGVNVREALMKNVPFCQYSTIPARLTISKPSQHISDLTPFMFSQDLLISVVLVSLYFISPKMTSVVIGFFTIHKSGLDWPLWIFIKRMVQIFV